MWTVVNKGNPILSYLNVVLWCLVGSLEGLKEFWISLSCAGASATVSAEKKHAVFSLIAPKLETFLFHAYVLSYASS